MKCTFNPDGTMFMVGPDHMPIPEGRTTVWFPDDLDYRIADIDSNGRKGIREVTATELDARMAEYMANYVNARKLAYPSIADQLDTLYHQGYDGWKAEIDAIKSLYPKP